MDDLHPYRQGSRPTCDSYPSTTTVCPCHRRSAGEVLVRRLPQHEIDRARRVWTHIDTFTAPETGQAVSTVQRLAMISVEEISETLEAAGFGQVKTYASWHARSPGPPEGPGIMVAARRGTVDRGIG